MWQGHQPSATTFNAEKNTAMKPLLLLPLLFLSTAPSQADTPPLPAPPATRISKPSEFISFEKFDRPDSLQTKPSTRGWQPIIGTWKIQNGVVTAAEAKPGEKSPGHSAFCQHLVDLQNFVLTAEFKLGDARSVVFRCSDIPAPGAKIQHTGYAELNSRAMWLSQCEGSGPTYKAEELTRMPLHLEKDLWHRVTLEVCEGKWLILLNDSKVIQAEHPRFLAQKARVILSARGEGAEFRNVALWKAQPPTAPN